MLPWHVVALAVLLDRHLFQAELLSGGENSHTRPWMCMEKRVLSACKSDHTLSGLRVVWVGRWMAPRGHSGA